MTQTIAGRCLCGNVTLSAQISKRAFAVCHCGMCRRWGGGPAFAVDVNNARFSGEESIATYDSSDWGQRGFCKCCGTHLFYRLKTADYMNVSLGLLDHGDGFEFQSQIFVDAKPDCYSFADRTLTMTEAEVLAKFGPPT